MTYSMIIEKRHSDPEYKNDIKTWPEVTAILRHGLDKYTIRVNIYKYSSDNRLLGSKCVTMGNLWDVTNSLKDTVLL